MRVCGQLERFLKIYECVDTLLEVPSFKQLLFIFYFTNRNLSDNYNLEKLPNEVFKGAHGPGYL